MDTFILSLILLFLGLILSKLHRENNKNCKEESSQTTFEGRLYNFSPDYENPRKKYIWDRNKQEFNEK